MSLDTIIAIAPVVFMVFFFGAMGLWARRSARKSRVQEHRAHAPSSGENETEIAQSRMEADTLRQTWQGLFR